MGELFGEKKGLMRVIRGRGGFSGESCAGGTMENGQVGQSARKKG